MKSKEDILLEIKKFSNEFYNKQDFAHNIIHGERVVKNAKKIMQIEGGDSFLIEAGAWLHQFHNDLDEIKVFIFSLDIDENDKNLLYEIARIRPEYINENSPIEVKIVYDADSIELLSCYGTIREILCNIKARDKSWEETINDTVNVQKRFFDKLMTDTAKEMIKEDIEIINKFFELYYKELNEEN